MNHAAVSYVERGDGRILCVWNSRYGGWTLPGGKVEEGETIEEAQERELLEETGLQTDVAHPMYSDETCIKDAPDDRGRMVYVFRVRPRSWFPCEMETGHPVTWFTRNEFLRWSPFAEFYTGMFETLNRLGVKTSEMVGGVHVFGEDVPFSTINPGVEMVANACDLDLDDIDTDRAIRALEQQWSDD